jgi:uncharacterized protein (DUF1501 family)
MALNRRNFLASSLTAGAAPLASSAFGSLLLAQAAAAESQASARDITGYKALVCVFLNGGNDSLNTVIPRDNSYYGLYSTARAGVGTGLAIAQNAILPITSATPQSSGALYGLHSAMPEIQQLFAANRCAIVANVGPLIEPITQAQFQNSSVPVPPQLFSHSDQQAIWQTSRPDTTARIGWGGRLADLLQAANTNGNLSMSMTLAGNNIFQTGNTVQPYSIGANGPVERQGYFGPEFSNRRAAIDALLAQSQAHPFERAFAQTHRRALDNYQFVANALTANAPLNTVFPNATTNEQRLSRQLSMVARLIQARTALDQRKQIYFVQMGGYDLHDRLLVEHADLLGALSRCLKAFYDATVEMGVANQVTTFTASDFGRTLSSNGDGTDHGWGAEHFVIGGAVNGGNIYGAMPLPVLGGADDASWGQIIPKIATDQYAATLARWLGASESQIDLILPRLGMFPASGGRNLGFMAA